LRIINAKLSEPVILIFEVVGAPEGSFAFEVSSKVKTVPGRDTFSLFVSPLVEQPLGKPIFQKEWENRVSR